MDVHENPEMRFPSLELRALGIFFADKNFSFHAFKLPVVNARQASIEAHSIV
jgi:hypothetical protein